MGIGYRDMSANSTVCLASGLDALGYQTIVVLILAIMAMGGVIMLLTHFLPKAGRKGTRKFEVYESGMEPIGDARRRFNVRFYLVAMLFLLFDVELIFMYPWARAFTAGAKGMDVGVSQAFLFYEMVIFFVILLVGYAYAWKKGIFRWD